MPAPRAPRPASPWPESLWVVRHGESSGNVARDRAEEQQLERIDIAERDMDVPLSPLGERQSRALGRWAAEQPDRPTVVWTSPYLRATDTARLALEEGGLDVPVHVDERLREREFGVLDLLTRRGIQARFPEEAQRRSRLGKFYHRPPGGESWTDVALRLRAFLDDLRRDAEGERVLLVAHQVVVLLVRYVVEELDEQGVLGLGSSREVANCSVTSYARDPAAPGGVRLTRFNEVAPMEQQHEQVTSEPDVQRASR